jgi:hypothetical protein
VNGRELRVVCVRNLGSYMEFFMDAADIVVYARNPCGALHMTGYPAGFIVN